MENTKQNETEKKYAIPEPKKKVPMFLIISVIGLAVIAILLAIKLYVNSNQYAEDKLYMQGEKNKLETELNGLIVEYDSLKSKADTLDSQLTAEQDRIKKLLSINASNATKIKMYKSELETLRKVMKSYIVQIDSLNTRNQALTSENLQVRAELGQMTNNYEELSQKSEELSSTVKIAQKLNAKNIVAEALNRNSKHTDKIKKTEKIRVCCVVRENAVARAGKKMVYLRIIRPDDVVLSSPDAGTFEYDGNSMAYSAKRELEYENSDIELCIYWDKTEDLIAGTYFVKLFSEGYEIGSGSVDLR